MKRKIFLLSIIIGLVVLIFVSTLLSGKTESYASATVSKYRDIEFLNEKEEEWYQVVEFDFNESEWGDIVCVEWQNNYNGSWQSMIFHTQRTYMDGQQPCEVRIIVHYEEDNEYGHSASSSVTSNELTIGYGEPEEVYQPFPPGTNYGACEQK